MKKLGEIAECFNGYTFRDKPINLSSGEARVIQMSDIAPPGNLDASLTIRISYNAAYNKFCVRVGDIVFRGRGDFGGVLVCQKDALLIAASPLIIVRPDATKVLSCYLLWFLNSKFAKQYFERSAQGTILKSIGIKELTQLTLPLPPLRKQQEIVDIAILLEREQELMKCVQEAKENLVMQSLLQTANQYDQTRKVV